MLFLCDVGLTVSCTAIAHPGVDFTGKHPAYLAGAGGMSRVLVLYISNGFPLGEAGKILPENILSDYACIFILLKPFIHNLIRSDVRSDSFCATASIMLILSWPSAVEVS